MEIPRRLRLLVRSQLKKWWRIAVAVLPFVLSPPILHAQNDQIPGCKNIAALPPVLTFGGPATVPSGATELAVGAGAWGSLFQRPCQHDTGVLWFGRWRRGLTNRLDVGLDFQGEEHASNQNLCFNAELRYRVLGDLRLEAGYGIGDDTEGKSTNGQFGLTTGVPVGNDVWGPYISVRLAAAHGYPGRSFAGSNIPAGALVPMAIFGTTARINENMKWVFEGGAGGILSREHHHIGKYVYVAVGLDFVVHAKKKK
jgi:hypothetical protein